MSISESMLHKVVAEDHRLEKASEGANRELMRHRWHWTLDESNPNRMSLSEYARQVGRVQSTISAHVHAYELLVSHRGPTMTVDEARERANMSAETAAATEAVAETRGLSLGYAKREFPREVRRVREEARQLAEERGTSVAEEAPKVARMVVREERAEQRHEETRKQRYGIRYVEIEAELDKARRHLLAAAKTSEDVDFDREERELLEHAVDTVRRLLDLIDRAIAGTRHTTWAEELKVIEGGA